MAINSFADRGTEDIFNGVSSKKARRTCPQKMRDVASRKLDLLNGATTLESLRIPPGNKLEQLSGDRKRQHSIRINDQYRVCFEWADAGCEAVEITDYH
jgi:proteic killer suppression protein